MSALAIAAAVLLCPVQEETYALRWAPTQGQKTSYLYQFEFADPKAAMKMSATMESAIQSVRKDGYITKTVSKNAVITLAGQEIRDERANPVVAQFGKRGEILKIVEGKTDAGAYEIGRFNKFVAPENAVKVGESWEYTYPAIERTAPSHKVSFKLIEVKQGPIAKMAKVTCEIGDASGKGVFKGTGTWIVNASTGEPETFEGAAEGVNGQPEMKFKLKMSRTAR